MPTVTFAAGGELPKKWIHRAGGFDGTRMLDPVEMHNGDSLTMSQSDADWLAAAYPTNFTVEA